jgi:hypothetical protein
MNYIIEDNFDFYSELNGAKVIPAIDKCLISHEPLTYNAITLPCSHRFNYLSLYTELRLSPNSKIICPYCRVVSSKLLPFIALPNVNKVPGINSPEKNCMPAPSCSWKIMNGIHKGRACGANGIESVHGTFCSKHFQKNNINDDWTAEMEVIFKTNTMVELKKSLRAAGQLIGGTKRELVKRLICAQ